MPSAAVFAEVLQPAYQFLCFAPASECYAILMLSSPPTMIERCRLDSRAEMAVTAVITIPLLAITAFPSVAAAFAPIYQH